MIDLRSQILTAHTLLLDLPEGSGRLVFPALQAETLAVGSATVAAAGLTAERSSWSFAGGTLEIAELRASDLRCALPPEDLSVELGGLVASDVRLTWRPLTLTIGKLEATSGLRWVAGALEVPRVHLTQVELVIEPLPLVPLRAPGSEPPSVDFLDKLHGRVDVDLLVDANIPFFGQRRRRATHHLRVPILDGAINFRELERDMSLLEDLVLDFEVKKDRLILEKDVPLVPFDNVTLYEWPLDARELALARRHKRVRLASLARGRAVPSKDPFEVVLHQLALSDIDVLLTLDAVEGGVTLPGGGELQLGTEGRPAIDQLGVRGAVVHSPAGAAQPGELVLSLEAVAAAARQLRLGATRLDAAAIHLGPVERGRLLLQGIAPRRLELTLAGGDAEHLRLCFGR